MLKPLFIATLFLVTFQPHAAAKNKQELLLRIRALADSSNGNIGVGVLGLDFADTILVNNKYRYPMLSVFKFPLGMFILNMVDKGKLLPDQQVTIEKRSLIQHTWSPMLGDFNADTFTMTVRDLMRYSISKSDNNACDLLFKLAGGPQKVNDYFKKSGIKGLAITASERDMSKGWKVQYTNWCYPSAMLRILQLFYSGALLQPASNGHLMKLMTETENSPQRLKGLLPASTVVAHKTGTGNTNANGITAATNDVGIITLPDGRHYAIVVYVSDFKGTAAQGEKYIAEISRLVWDYYTGEQ